MEEFVHWYFGIVSLVSRRLVGAEPSRLLALPPDVVESVLEFLTGFDLLALSHVNRHFYRGVLAADARIWQRLAPPASVSNTFLPYSTSPAREASRLNFWDSSTYRELRRVTAKQRYFAHRSVRFHGKRLSGMDRNDRGGAIEVPRATQIARAGSFSFDLVFTLLPTLDANLTRSGGVVLGAQSVSVTHNARAATHAAFVHTDAEGNWRCSVMNHAPVLAQRLAFNRWYHVALVFEVTGPRCATQRVYLDGVLVDVSDGWLHNQWEDSDHVQLGTGCVVGGDWYAFNGLVDECRFWSEPLDADHVRDLASGDATAATSTSDATCTWSMRDQTSRSLGLVSLARSTSPAERVVRDVETTGALSNGSIPWEGYEIVYCHGLAR